MKASLFDPQSHFFHPLALLADVLILSAAWLLGVALIVPAGAVSVALYEAVCYSLREDGFRALARFWDSTRRHFLPALPSGFLVIGLLFSFLSLRQFMVTEINLYGDRRLLLFYRFFQFFSLAILSVLCLIFPLLSRFDFTTSGLWSTALKFFFLYPIRSLASGLLTLLTALLLLRTAFLIWPLFLLPALEQWLLSFLLEPVFDFYREKARENGEIKAETKDL